jgi:hypothetical protein
VFVGERRFQRPVNPDNYLAVSDLFEAAIPLTDQENEWNDEFGWVRRNGHITQAGKAYFRREDRMKQQKEENEDGRKEVQSPCKDRKRSPQA